MEENKEIKALLHLIDDPDEEVYCSVSNKIVSLGKEIIPNLENLWENIESPDAQERIELLIHELHFQDLLVSFHDWIEREGDLLEGALLVAKYHYPDSNDSTTLQEIEKLRRNTWLELNNYLTPLEKINIVNSIFYNYYKQTGVEISYEAPDNFLINKSLESRKGNAISNGIIYIILCEQLDLPVNAINIPRQFILGYFDDGFDEPAAAGHASEKIKFYIDALTGQMYSHKDIENYFKRLSVPPVSSYFRGMTAKKIIQFLLEEISKCYEDSANTYKAKELRLMAAMLE
ncbi:MAG: transglutaminase-like domain-containing protein [Ferruginibacter sp.]